MIHIALLGPLELRVGDEPVPVGGPGRRALVASLALNHGCVVPVQHLVDVIWDDDPPATAVTKVQGHVYALRRELSRLGGREVAEALRTRAPGYLLDCSASATDLADFVELTAAPAASDAADPRERVVALRRALDLWRGPACADVGSPLIQAMAVRLEERRMSAVEDLAEALFALHRFGEALDELDRLVKVEPFRERAWEQIMRGHLALGHPAAALASYREVRRVLATELGIAPGERIRRLARAIARPGAPERGGPERGTVSETLRPAATVTVRSGTGRAGGRGDRR